MTYTLTENKTYGTIEVKFSEKPSESIRTMLKSLKFKWHNVNKCWFGSYDIKELEKKLDEVASTATINKVATGGTWKDGYMGGNEWIGANYSKNEHLSYGDINKIVKKELRRLYPNVSFKTRGKSYSGGQSSTCSIELHTNELVKPFDEFKTAYLKNRGRASWYSMKDGSSVYVQNMTNELYEEAAEASYRYYTSTDCINACNDDFFTDYANEILQKATSLYDSFIHDDSNSMVDYFNCSLYVTYYFVNLDV